VADGDDDLGQAVARLPGEDARREAGELLTRIRSLSRSSPDAIRCPGRYRGAGDVPLKRKLKRQRFH
jgi:hypothetical protein